ncbi:MAG: aldehyde dehydrogenase family protein, partial [Acidimicrobiales bacterium]
MTITPPATVDAAVANKTLRATFESGRTRPLAWRKQQLAGLRQMMIDGDAELTEALHQDLGRPSMEAYAADIGHTKAELRHIA